MSRTEHDKSSESTAELVKDLSREVSELVRQEIALARAEMMEKGRKAGRGAGMLSGAAVFALAAVGGSMATLILLLDLAMPAWLAALIVTAVYAAAAALLGMRGKTEISEVGPPTPERTVESVKEDVQWAKTRVTSSNR